MLRHRHSGIRTSPAARPERLRGGCGTFARTVPATEHDVVLRAAAGFVEGARVVLAERGHVLAGHLRERC